MKNRKLKTKRQLKQRAKWLWLKQPKPATVRP